MVLQSIVNAITGNNSRCHPEVGEQQPPGDPQRRPSWRRQLLDAVAHLWVDPFGQCPTSRLDGIQPVPNRRAGSWPALVDAPGLR